MVNSIQYLQHVSDSLSTVIDSLNTVIAIQKQFTEKSWIDKWLPTFVAIGGILITVILAFVAGHFTLLQMKSNIISSSRITWINELRKMVAGYSTSVFQLSVHINSSIERKKQPNYTLQQKEEDYVKYEKLSSEIIRLGFMIRMFLHTKEPIHESIEIAVGEINQYLLTPINPPNTKQLEDVIHRFIFACKDVYKEEWEKSKRLYKYK